MIRRLLCTAVLIASPTLSAPAIAEELTIDVTAEAAVQEALRKLTGKSVTLRLDGGAELSGLVEAVGETAVRIGQLTGKEFYSAVVRLDEVAAVIYRAK